VLNQLANGEHSVVSGGLELLVGLLDRGVAEDELVVVGLLERVGEVGGAAAVQAGVAPAGLGGAADARGEFGERLSCERAQQVGLVLVVPVGRRSRDAGRRARTR
jgi:hypothetical protein